MVTAPHDTHLHHRHHTGRAEEGEGQVRESLAGLDTRTAHPRSAEECRSTDGASGRVGGSHATEGLLTGLYHLSDIVEVIYLTCARFVNE